MTTRKYAVHSSFLTIQGEGYHAGRRAVFVRFSGCNVWNGHEEDRERDSKNGFCARICDTEFVGMDAKNGGGLYTRGELTARVLDLWGEHKSPFVVFTGGEPGLQLDDGLVKAFRDHGVYTAVETNGSKLLPMDISWRTLSPKPPMPVVVQHYDEVKCLYPFVDPLEYEKFSNGLFWVQPTDYSHGIYAVGDTRRVNREVVEKSLEFVMHHPKWRMAAQLHKLWRIP